MNQTVNKRSDENSHHKWEIITWEESLVSRTHTGLSPLAYSDLINRQRQENVWEPTGSRRLRESLCICGKTTYPLLTPQEQDSIWRWSPLPSGSTLQRNPLTATARDSPHLHLPQGMFPSCSSSVLPLSHKCPRTYLLLDTPHLIKIHSFNKYFWTSSLGWGTLPMAGSKTVLDQQSVLVKPTHTVWGGVRQRSAVGLSAPAAEERPHEENGKMWEQWGEWI